MNDDNLISVDIQPSPTTIDVGVPCTLTAVFNPSNWSNQKGTWSYDPDYVSPIYNQNDNFFIFKGLKSGKTNITFTADDLPDSPATDSVTIKDIVLEKVVLKPEVQDVKFGGFFSINVSYIPEAAPHIGEWSYDKLLLEKLGTSTADRADFQVISNIDHYTSTDIFFYSPDVNSPTKAKSSCNITEKPASKVLLDPHTVDKKAGDDFYIDIQYDPIDCDPVGAWIYDDKYFKLLTDSTNKKAHFQALIASDPNDQSTKVLSYAVNQSVTDSVFCNIDYADLMDLTFKQPSETVKAGEDFYIDVVYIPDNAKHDGKWLAVDPTYLRNEDDSTVDRGHFTALQHVPLPIQIMFATPGFRAKNMCTIDYADLTSLSLTPTSKNVKAGDKFDIYITYEPDTANHFGSWVYNADYLKLVNTDDYYDVSTFEALQHSDQPLTLTYYSGSLTADFTCNIDYATLQNVSFNQSTETIELDSDFYLDVTYTPNNARHGGTLEYDSMYLTEMDDSTFDRLHFQSNDNMNFDGTTIKLKADNNKEATNICKIGFQKIEGFKMNPTYNIVKSGETFTIAIDYIPSNAEHNGINKWYTDSTYVQQDYSRSSNDLMTFKALTTTTNNGSAMLFNPYPDVIPPGINYCFINTKDVQSVVLIPPEKQFTEIGESFVVQVSYTPNDVPHIGDWYYDNTIFEMDVANSTYNYGIFKLLQKADGDVISFTSNSKTGTCYCTMAQKGDYDEK